MSVFLGVTAFAAGILSASGLFALLVSIKLVNRIALFAGVSDCIRVLEECVVSGAILGCVFFVFEIATKLGYVGGVIFILFAGTFMGALVVALAEVIKAIPIFVRRVRISGSLAWILIVFALGKLAGGLYDVIIR